MSKVVKTNADRLSVGWMLAGMLVFSLSHPAGALDLNSEIKRQNQTSNEIGNTLGRDRGAVEPKLPGKPARPKKPLPSLDEADMQDDYKVELVPIKRDKST